MVNMERGIREETLWLSQAESACYLNRDPHPLSLAHWVKSEEVCGGKQQTHRRQRGLDACFGMLGIVASTIASPQTNASVCVCVCVHKVPHMVLCLSLSSPSRL